MIITTPKGQESLKAISISKIEINKDCTPNFENVDQNTALQFKQDTNPKAILAGPKEENRGEEKKGSSSVSSLAIKENKIKTVFWVLSGFAIPTQLEMQYLPRSRSFCYSHLFFLWPGCNCCPTGPEKT
jgi:hypothetical protein